MIQGFEVQILTFECFLLSAAPLLLLPAALWAALRRAARHPVALLCPLPPCRPLRRLVTVPLSLVLRLATAAPVPAAGGPSPTHLSSLALC